MGRSGRSQKKLASTLLGQRPIALGSSEPASEPELEVEKEEKPISFLDSYSNNDYNLPRAKKVVGSLLLMEGEKLVNYDSPTNKEYTGSILIGKDKSTGKTVYQAACYFGPGGKGHAQVKVYYEGDSLDAARQAIQTQLIKKINSGYSAPTRGTGFDIIQFSSRLPKI
jgi:hypothetical protein